MAVRLPWPRLAAAAFLFPLAFASPASPPQGWHDTYASAQTAAKKSGKDVFLCFTGTEWSAVCRQFETRFLADPAFATNLNAHFEPVRLDVSEFRSLGPAEASREDLPEKARLKLEFEVTTFPIAFLVGRDGLPYAVTGFRPGSVEAYGAHLDQLREKNATGRSSLERARKASGLRRAELLVQSIPDLGDLRTARFYGDRMREVIALDPENRTGSAREYELQLADLDYVQTMRTLDRDVRWTEMVQLTDDYIRRYELTGSRRQAALMNRFDLHRRLGNLRDMISTLDEVTRINPYNPHGRQAALLLREFARQMEASEPLESPAGPE
jgi:hypothetical protein